MRETCETLSALAYLRSHTLSQSTHAKLSTLRLASHTPYYIYVHRLRGGKPHHRRAPQRKVARDRVVIISWANFVRLSRLKCLSLTESICRPSRNACQTWSAQRVLSVHGCATGGAWYCKSLPLSHQATENSVGLAQDMTTCIHHRGSCMQK